jgi:hypothetical protein
MFIKPQLHQTEDESVKMLPTQPNISVTIEGRASAFLPTTARNVYQQLFSTRWA